MRIFPEAAAKLRAKTYIQQSIVWVARPSDDSFFDEETVVQVPDVLYASAFDGEQIASEAGEKYGLPGFPSFRVGIGEVVETWRAEGFAN